VRTTNLRAWLGAAVLGLAAALPARADVITFEGVAPSLYFDGESFNAGAMQFTLGNAPGLFGFGTVDTAAAYSLFGNAPTGTQGQFLGVLNDGAVFMGAGGGTFRLAGLDFGFIAPLSGLAGGGAVGQLVALGLTSSGDIAQESWDFADNGLGSFSMATLGLSDMGSMGGLLTEVAFYACLYDGKGGCLAFSGDNLGQFALDNIKIPEPASLGLVALALGLLAAGRRRARL
jgi:hypothetical protein